MIAEPLTRRSVVIGGLIGTAALSGCSASAWTTRKVEDPEAPDRGRIARAITLSSQLRSLIENSPSGSPQLRSSLGTFRALHDLQIAHFERSAGLRIPSVLGIGAGGLDLVGLQQHERDLAHAFRDLALGADHGEVAALLASAAAGIDQALAR